MHLEPNSLDGYMLLHHGSLALADVEENGIRFDVDYCKRQRKHLKRRIEHIKNKLDSYDEVKLWRKTYRKNFNIDSNDQLANILFNKMGYEAKVLTKTGKPSASAESLEQLHIPIVDKLMQMKRLQKARNTYIKNYLREAVNSIIHPFFNLHTVDTYRSSSNNPNFQNVPVRIEEIKRIVRRAVIPRDGHLIGEIDYSGAEVRCATCYHKDPNMIKDVSDKKRDMHRDMAMRCFKLPLDEFDGSKRAGQIRYCGKNMFVFPQFYGDYYVHNARDLWDAVTHLKLTTRDGQPIIKHMKREGIGTYNRFELHLETVEDYFWNERYPVYAEWKEKHWEEYQRRGYVELKTGFVCRGVFERNKAINYPVQGSAFHWLLWSLIILNRWMKKTKKISKIIGQIHDSIVFDLHPSEINEIFAMARKIMTKMIKEHWKWINIPLDIEMELSPKDGTWYLKKEVKEQKRACKCGNLWLYEKKTDTSIIKICPVCGKRYEK